MNEIERKHTNKRMSKIVHHAGVIYLCGQTASGGVHATADITVQTQEVLSRIDALLSEAGSSRSHLLSVTIYLKNIDDFAAMNAVWESWISPGTAPARTTVEATLATASLLVEMTVIAASS